MFLIFILYLYYLGGWVFKWMGRWLVGWLDIQGLLTDSTPIITIYELCAKRKMGMCLKKGTSTLDSFKTQASWALKNLDCSDLPVNQNYILHVYRIFHAYIEIEGRVRDA